MLYRKIHRQYVRQFIVGRRFRWYNGEVRKVIGKPNIDYFEGAICVKVKYYGPSTWSDWGLIVINDNYYGLSIGARLDKDKIKWLD